MEKTHFLSECIKIFTLVCLSWCSVISGVFWIFLSRSLQRCYLASAKPAKASARCGHGVVPAPAPQDRGLRLVPDSQANGTDPFFVYIMYFSLGGRGVQFPQHSRMVNILGFALALVLPLLRHMKESLVYWGERTVLLY